MTVTAVDTGGPGPATGIRSVYVSLAADVSGSGGVSERLIQVAPGTWRTRVRLVRGTGVHGTLDPW